MGDINFDLSKNKKFIFIPYTCAAIGAGTTAFMAPAVIPGGIAAHIAVGAIAGGIGLPVIGTVAAVGVIVLLAAGKELFKIAKKEGAMIPLGIAVIGFSSVKALFVTPVQALTSGLKKLFSKKERPEASTPKTSKTIKPSLKDKTSKGGFNSKAVAKKKPTAKPKTKPNSPKPNK